MNFECFVCGEKFADENITINHLQKQHGIKDHSTELKCLVNYEFCGKTYLTYSGLRKHLKKCSKKQYHDHDNVHFFEVIRQIYFCSLSHLWVINSMNNIFQTESSERNHKL